MDPTIASRTNLKVLRVPLFPDPATATPFELGNAPPPKYRGPGAALTFLSTRTAFVGMPRLLGGDPVGTLERGRAPGILLLELGGLPDRTHLEVAVRFRGEPPTLAKIEWATDVPLPELGLTVPEQFHEREKAISKLPSDLHPFAEFFLDYDRKTNLTLGEVADAGDAKAVGALQSTLCRRVLNKARKYPSGLYPKDGASAQVQEMVQRLSDLQLAIYAGPFGGGPPNVPEGLKLAFQHFTSGALRASDVELHKNAEPDSAWYFLFAEFALLAAKWAEPQDARDFWLDFGRTLAWRQLHFVHHYAPNAPAATGAMFKDYDPTQYDGAPAPALLDKLLPDYEAADRAQLHELTAKAAHAAFPGEHGLTEYPCP